MRGGGATGAAAAAAARWSLLRCGGTGSNSVRVSAVQRGGLVARSSQIRRGSARAQQQIFAGCRRWSSNSTLSSSINTTANQSSSGSGGVRASCWCSLMPKGGSTMRHGRQQVTLPHTSLRYLSHTQSSSAAAATAGAAPWLHWHRHAHASAPQPQQPQAQHQHRRRYSSNGETPSVADTLPLSDTPMVADAHANTTAPSTVAGAADQAATRTASADDSCTAPSSTLPVYSKVTQQLLGMLRRVSEQEENAPQGKKATKPGLIEQLVEEKRCVSQVQEYLAMFEVHVQNGNINLAEEILYNEDLRLPITTDKFNILLKHCAKHTYDLRCESIFNHMLHMNVPPDATTYALLILAIRRHDKPDAIRHILQLAADMGFSHHDMLRAPLFATDINLLDLFKKQLQRVGLADASRPRPHVVDVELYEQQWNQEASLGVSLDAIPTRSTREAFDEFMAKPNVDSETNMSAYHIWIDDIAAAIDHQREIMVSSPKQVDAELAWKILYNSFVDSRAIATAALSVFEHQTAANPYGCKMNSMVMSIGRAVYRTFAVALAREAGPSDLERTVYARYHQIMSDREQMKKHSPSKLWRQLMKEYSIESGVSVPNEDSGLAFWTPRMLGAVGGEMIDLVLRKATLSAITGRAEDKELPAFYHTYEFEGTKRFGFIRTHDTVQDYSYNFVATNAQLGKNVFRRSIDAVNLPMLVLPKPWTGVRTGASLVSPVTIMRTFDSHFHHYALLAETTHLLDDMFDALTYLSSMAWRVNTKVFDVVRAAFEAEVGVEELAIAPHIIQPPPVPARTADMSAEDKAKYQRQVMEHRKQSSEAYSQRTTLHLKLMVAQALRDQDFYLPHNLDFRGRAYTIAPYLTHIGDDLSRGLLVFAEKKPLGKNGLRWLKIHLANVYGNDKCSLDDREKFAEDNMHHVEETVRNPLRFLEDGEPMWWLQGDNPWQVLAVCNELHDAMCAPNPEEFESGFPVHQDGTCNGLQHYAALGRDVEGARHVNLVRVPEDDRPQDVYSAVARTIDTHLQRHAQGDFSSTSKLPVSHEVAQELASLLVAQGPMKRKIVKQTVMTNVYGVTFVGGREQIGRQLKAAKVVPPEKVYATASYLTALVFLSLGEIFEKAQLIQQWLSQQAKKIAASGEPVAWVTPIGMPVVQPYHNAIKSTFSTNLQTIWLVETGNPSQLPAVGKQGSAFPPNFVHSLDSTHMMMTANACRKDGVAFASVHDSYWTHAATVDQMSRHTREQFVNIHSRPLLKDLHSFFRLQYEGRKYVRPRGNDETTVEIDPCPEQGEFDINEVLNSKYFFS
ncbi:single-subunit RNA polymerase [Salpingoeca rosetta]|uniref:DNA-directed RNA polymerase n=1 Tax=Salpingoeca rosetta (strain ATCC 50818 / BSB-021) TaxID=946362 RepID=F2U5G9_SALR5|nr:single-subunit RNA polymerase [Salpingoeca rosetta]EGD83185.1 single-subunit RNA polymerase [Salpingoeca rosetta]|eukprot:XP_004995549.1 single-subunit RNA polymerase [Salpingoeca rosetta]